MNSPLSAQVILKPASGVPVDPSELITAANIDKFLPSREVAAAARKDFAGLGFDVGPLVGTSFSITASQDTFEGAFGVSLTALSPGAATLTGGTGESAYEMPRDRLPEHLARGILTVTFSPPDEFHP